tara:strand:- start:299 stop:628 length:330 start_codon:yes stop_codon:yes gene_type:complete
VLSLLAQLLGPASGLPAKEGFVAICTGSEIIYIPISDLGRAAPADDRSTSISEACPWFAQFHAVEIEPVTTAYEVVAYEAGQPCPVVIEASAQHTHGTFQARAPPQSVA